MKELNEYERKELAEVSMREHAALNFYNGAERAARRAKQELERVQAEKWSIVNRILRGVQP